jgi:hypothetical protein
MSMVTRSKSLIHRALSAALFVTFAGTLFSQSIEKDQQSQAATPDLMASITKLDMSRYERPQESVSQASVSKDTAAPIPGSLSKPYTSLDGTLTLPKFNTIANVQEKGVTHNSFVRVSPDVLPLNVRLDPTALPQYGAAPAVARLSFGRK